LGGSVEKGRIKEIIKQGLWLFVAISVLTYIVLFLVSGEDGVSYIFEFSPVSLLLSIGLWLGYIGGDIARIMVLSKGIGKPISFVTGMYVSLTGHFFAAVTPTQSGGIPMQLYVLYKSGLSIAEGSIVLFLRGALFGVMCLFLSPLALPYIIPHLSGESFRAIIILEGVVLIIGVVGLYCIFRYPLAVERWVGE